MFSLEYLSLKSDLENTLLPFSKITLEFAVVVEAVVCVFCCYLSTGVDERLSALALRRLEWEGAGVLQVHSSGSGLPAACCLFIAACAAFLL